MQEYSNSPYFLYYARGYKHITKADGKKSGLLSEKRRNDLITSMEKLPPFI